MLSKTGDTKENRNSTVIVRFVAVLAIAFAAMAIAPRMARADVLICNDQGGCAGPFGTNLGLGCSAFQPLPAGDFCFLVGAVMAPDTHLTLDASGGPVLVLNGKNHKLIFPTPAGEDALNRAIKGGRAGGVDKAKWSKDIQLALNQIFLASGQKVSQDKLVKLSKDMKVPFVKENPKVPNIEKAH